MTSAMPDLVTFPATEHHRPLAGTKLYCSVTKVGLHECEQLAQGRYMKAARIESTPRPVDRKSNALTIRLSHFTCVIQL